MKGSSRNYGKWTINYQQRQVIPEVTALIPTFERPKLLRRAITSVLNQSYGNVKVKIFDDASNDETQDVVVKMQQGDKRIIYHRQDNFWIN